MPMMPLPPNDATVAAEDRLGYAIRLQCGGLYAIWLREVKFVFPDMATTS